MLCPSPIIEQKYVTNNNLYHHHIVRIWQGFQCTPEYGPARESAAQNRSLIKVETNLDIILCKICSSLFTISVTSLPLRTINTYLSRYPHSRFVLYRSKVDSMIVRKKKVLAVAYDNCYAHALDCNQPSPLGGRHVSRIQAAKNNIGTYCNFTQRISTISISSLPKSMSSFCLISPSKRYLSPGRMLEVFFSKVITPTARTWIAQRVAKRQLQYRPDDAKTHPHPSLQVTETQLSRFEIRWVWWEVWDFAAVGLKDYGNTSTLMTTGTIYDNNA